MAPTDDKWEELANCWQSTEIAAAVIMPVYKGYNETLAAIYHVLKNKGRSPYKLVVINDDSPDEKLSKKLNELSEKGIFDYHINRMNLGFVKTVNSGIQNFSNGLDVVLLNSDAYVFSGWFDRLKAHADRNERIATVTPLTNNGTICSYPCYNQDNNLHLEVDGEKIDQIAAKVNKDLCVHTPTGVGFCMYMRRSVIELIGDLDEDNFSIGYGEENDFCMRALYAGFLNVIAADVFVMHKGSVSFDGIKDENYINGQAALEKKHPYYNIAVKITLRLTPNCLLDVR